MTEHVLSGLRPRPLASYLAGLGLFRVLAEQRDAGCRGWWSGDGLHLETHVTDLGSWLAREYVPTPVLSPWNEGSGFGAKDKTPKEALRQIEERQSPRFDAFRIALKPARLLGERARTEGWDKGRTVREYRNRCPDHVVPWVDASVVLADQQTFFPPLLGTGGNDGRLDFSTTFHQRLLDVIGVESQGGAAAVRWAEDLLHGTQFERLRSAAIGQFDPAGAGGKNSSPHGDADSLVNPWAYILLVEGSLLFAAGVARRLGHGVGRAAMPFTLRSSPHGASSGAAGESTSSRGEIWAPLWSVPFSYVEMQQLFGEARASWRGRPAQQAVQMYQAVMSHGVARGVDRYVRYGLHQRNGLAFVAVALDDVRVIARPEVSLAASLEDWPSRVRRAQGSAAVEVAVQQFDAAHLHFARDGGVRAMASLLAARTDLEIVVGRSGRLRQDLPAPMPPLHADKILRWIEGEGASSAELRVAAGLASLAAVPDAHPSRSLRHLLLPIDPRVPRDDWREAAVVPGFGIRPLRDVLIDVLVWRLRESVRERSGDPEASSGSPIRGARTFPFGSRVPATDLHAWAGGDLDEVEVELWLKAFLALSWQKAQVRWWQQPGDDVIPVPLLGLLHPLATGLSTAPAQSGPTRCDVPRLALDPATAELLRSGRLDDVSTSAVRRLRQAGWSASPPRQTATDGRAIAAALLPRCSGALTILGRLADRQTSSAVTELTEPPPPVDDSSIASVERTAL